MPPSPVSQSVTIDRTLVGIIAVVMLVGAGVLWFFVGSQNMWTGACVKVGVVMGAFWLALPTFSRQGNWGQASLGTVVGFVALALVLMGKRVDFRIVLPMLLGIAITLMVLRPRSKTRSK
jgi:hypothetical protein